MAFRFYKRIRILPGISINLGKKGASVSVGPRGAKMTIGGRGTKTSIGIPGTGIRYETPYRRGGAGGLNPNEKVPVSFFLMCVFGAVLFSAFQIHTQVKSPTPVCVSVMIIAGVAALICGVKAVFAFCSSGEVKSKTATQSAYARAHSRSLRNPSNPYLREVAKASQDIYVFLKELCRSPRCRNILKRIAGMEQMDKVGGDEFAVNPRL